MEYLDAWVSGGGVRLPVLLFCALWLVCLCVCVFNADVYVGRSPHQVANRVDALISEIKEKVLNTAASWPGGSIVAHATGEARDIVCIGHGHVLSAMALRWAGQSLANGLRLLLEPSSVAVLGYVCLLWGLGHG